MMQKRSKHVHFVDDSSSVRSTIPERFRRRAPSKVVFNLASPSYRNQVKAMHGSRPTRRSSRKLLRPIKREFLLGRPARRKDMHGPRRTEHMKVEPTRPIKRELMIPIKRELMRPIKREPMRPIKREPTRPIKREPTRPIKREPTRPIKREPTRPIKREPTRPIKRELMRPIKVDSTTPIKREFPLGRPVRHQGIHGHRRSRPIEVESTTPIKPKFPFGRPVRRQDNHGPRRTRRFKAKSKRPIPVEPSKPTKVKSKRLIPVQPLKPTKVETTRHETSRRHDRTSRRRLQVDMAPAPTMLKFDSRRLKRILDLSSMERDRKGRLISRFHKVFMSPKGALYYMLTVRRADGKRVRRKKYLNARQSQRCLQGTLRNRGGVCSS